MALVLNGSNDTITGLQINSANIVDGSIAAADLATGVGGKVVQVKYALKTDTFSSSSTSFVDITGLTVTITPTSTSNYILIYAMINGDNNGSKSSGRLMRDSTAIGIGDASSSRVRGTFDLHNSGASNRGMNINAMWVEQAQSTNSTVYKVQMRHENGSGDFVIGRQFGDSDNTSATRTSNSLVVMEFQT